MIKRTPLKILIINIAKSLNLKIKDLSVKAVASSTLYEVKFMYFENEIEKSVNFTLDYGREEQLDIDLINNTLNPPKPDELLNLPTEQPVDVVKS